MNTRFSHSFSPDSSSPASSSSSLARALEFFACAARKPSWYLTFLYDCKLLSRHCHSLHSLLLLLPPPPPPPPRHHCCRGGGAMVVLLELKNELASLAGAENCSRNSNPRVAKLAITSEFCTRRWGVGGFNSLLLPLTAAAAPTPERNHCCLGFADLAVEFLQFLRLCSMGISHSV